MPEHLRKIPHCAANSHEDPYDSQQPLLPRLLARSTGKVADRDGGENEQLSTGYHKRQHWQAYSRAGRSTRLAQVS